jgi:hypothetical protein
MYALLGEPGREPNLKSFFFNIIASIAGFRPEAFKTFLEE